MPQNNNTANQRACQIGQTLFQNSFTVSNSFTRNVLSVDRYVQRAFQFTVVLTTLYYVVLIVYIEIKCYDCTIISEQVYNTFMASNCFPRKSPHNSFPNRTLTGTITQRSVVRALILSCNKNISKVIKLYKLVSETHKIV